MSTNFRHSSYSIQITATAAVVGGSLQVVGSLAGVAETTAAVGEQYTLALSGAYAGLPKKTGETWAVGDAVYYDSTASALTKTASTNMLVGAAAEVAESAAATGCVLLKQ